MSPAAWVVAALSAGAARVLVASSCQAGSEPGISGQSLLVTRTQVSSHSRQDEEDGAGCVPPGMRAVPVHAGAFDMVVLGDNDIVSRALARTGRWEVGSLEEMARKVNTTLPKTGVLLDIGANIGYYSLMFAHRGYHVVAVEPMTRNRKAIEGSLCLNPHLRSLVTVVPAALVAPAEAGSTHCVIRSSNYRINIGNGVLNCGSKDAGFKPCSKSDQNCEEVPVKTLDQVLADVAPPSVTVVKMDIEGYECNMLKGGASLFSSYKPKLVQAETKFGNSSTCIHEVAAANGYALFPDRVDTRLLRKRVFLTQLG
mmetsp:Transcript_30625/g.95161  ORF Transcript_30625/g.95161 Transcript_30625/m.95161 type:complete len:312 (+) Transcript_30625:76-1011(+)